MDTNTIAQLLLLKSIMGPAAAHEPVDAASVIVLLVPGILTVLLSLGALIAALAGWLNNRTSQRLIIDKTIKDEADKKLATDALVVVTKNTEDIHKAVNSTATENAQKMVALQARFEELTKEHSKMAEQQRADNIRTSNIAAATPAPAPTSGPILPITVVPIGLSSDEIALFRQMLLNKKAAV